MAILSSGNMRDFGGAVRDMGDGKGRFDLIPLDVMAAVMNNPMIGYMSMFENDGDIAHLYDALDVFCTEAYEGNRCKMMLEVAKHYEEGCKKYGTDNWKRGDGIPVWSYIDSTCRHYLKWLDGQTDESHDRAVTWNLMCLLWTLDHIEQKGHEAVPVEVPEVIEEITINANELDDFEDITIDLESVSDLLPLEV